MYKRKSYKAFVINCLLVAAGMALCSFFVYFPLTDTDIFWHLAAGREILLRKHFLYTDPFAFSILLPQWIDLHWLFQVIVYGLYTLGNEKILIVFKLVMVAGVAGILCTARRTTLFIVITSFLAAVLFYEIRYLICLRPGLITMLCMSLYIFFFEGAAGQSEEKKRLWLCIPLQMLWTNSQGLYMIGLFIIGAYWFENFIGTTIKKEKRSWRMTMVLAIAALSCLINPYGIDGLRLPLALFQRINPDSGNIFSMNISENVPLFALTGYDAAYRTLVIITALVACAAFILNRKEIRVAHYALFIGFSALASMAERNVLLYVIVVIPLIGYHASKSPAMNRVWEFMRLKRRWAYTVSVPALLFLIFAVIQHSTVVATYPPDRNLSPFRFPEKICEYLKENPCPGNMFNDIRYGGYLIWNFYPQKQVFIDGRLIIRPPEFFREYLAVCDDPDRFTRVVKEFDITHAILPWAVFDLHRKLIRWLYKSPDWHLEYTDGASVLFVRNDISGKPGLRLDDQAVNDVILDSIGEQWKNAPFVRGEAMGCFSEMLDSLGFQTAAKMVKIRARNLQDR